MQQNSDKWLEWRRQGVGASDAPIILEVSPFKTPNVLWQEKMGLQESKGNFITQKGHNLEPKARARFEFSNGGEFPPSLAEKKGENWLRASLDGYSEIKNEILEIKFVGKADYELAKNGQVPEKYWPQLQHQFLVTGAIKGWYYSFDGEQGVAVEVFPDIEYIENTLYPKLHEFYHKYMLGKEAPPMNDKDVLTMEDETVVALANRYAEIDDGIKHQKTLMDKIKKDLQDKMTHPKMKAGRLTLTKTYKKGNVDYGKVPQLEGVALEEFRKKGSSSLTIRVGKK